jgi:hypothetical protein
VLSSFFILIADSGELEDGPEVALGACDRGLHSLEFVLLLPRRTLGFLRGLAGGSARATRDWAGFVTLA